MANCPNALTVLPTSIYHSIGESARACKQVGVSCSSPLRDLSLVHPQLVHAHIVNNKYIRSRIKEHTYKHESPG